MTSKTSLKVGLFAALIAAMILPFSGMYFADAESEIRGKTIILSTPSDNLMPLDKERLREINSDMNRSDLSSSEKTSLEVELKQMESDLMKWTKDNDDPEKESVAREKQYLIREIKSDDSGKYEVQKALLNSIPITSRGYDYVHKSLEITITPEAFNSKNLSDYIEDIRSVIGHEVDLTISPQPYAVPSACADRNDFCDEPEGGMEIGIGGTNAWCSIGFRADQSGTEGFITAGHCFRGVTNSTQMPAEGDTISLSVDHNFPDGTGTIDCDCAFVETDDSVIDEMSDNIFGTNNPNSAESSGLSVGVTKSGATTGVEHGFVTKLDDDIEYDYAPFNDPDGNVEFDGATKTTMYSEGGDSGGPVIKQGVAKLTGIHVANTDPEGSFTSWFMPENEIRDDLNITWDF